MSVCQIVPEAGSQRDEVVARANALFSADQPQHFDRLIRTKIEQLRCYDVRGMNRVAAVLSWGRSGSLLLSSYLDGHADVLMLPQLCGWKLFEFFERYRPLPLREKLLAYPAYETVHIHFFDGDFAISPVDYCAAVEAISEFYRDWPTEFLESRRAFLLFVHIAYNLALDRRPENPNPLIVYAQHLRNDARASELADDFPETKFVHTVRDPISTYDRTFHYFVDSVADRHTQLPYTVLYDLLNDDQPHSGMESRTRAIRFEDLHSDAAGTLRHLCAWLGVADHPKLRESTFNGIPYVVAREGSSWTGPRLDQAARQSRYLSRKDRALLFVLFYDNFVLWKYPFPKAFRHLAVRWVVFGALVLTPLGTEIAAAKAIFRHRISPAVRHANLSRALRSLVGIGLVRLKIIKLVVSAFVKRSFRRPLLIPIVPPE